MLNSSAQSTVIPRTVLVVEDEPINREIVSELIREAGLSVDIAEKVIRKTLNSEKEQMEMIDRMLDEVLSRKS